MRFLINDDNGRLTEARGLGVSFEMLDNGLEQDAKALARRLGEVTEEHILFLHSDALEALNLLEEIEQSGWPLLLRGVVVFNSSRFAGLRDNEDVKTELEMRGLSSAPIHVVRNAIHDNRPQEVLDRISRFASALQSGRPFVSSVWLLDPPEGLDAFLPLWVLNRLVRSDANLPTGSSVKSYVLEHLDHASLRAAGEKFGVVLEVESESVLEDLLDAITHQCGEWTGELLCHGCNIRQNRKHFFQDRSNIEEDRGVLLDGTANIYAGSTTKRQHRAKMLAQAMPISGHERLLPFIEVELNKFYAERCHFDDAHVERVLTHIQRIKLDTAKGNAQIAEELLRVLDCDLYNWLEQRAEPVSWQDSLRI